MFTIKGNIIDLFERRIYYGEVSVENGRIAAVRPLEGEGSGWLLPGFTDAHVHIESSMLTPSSFGRMAVAHGTVATVSDPHEIANVLGAAGVAFMLEDAARTPFKCCFGAPSCVPATTFETAGATLDAAAVTALLERDDIYYLSEMMNFPGVLYNDEGVMAKIAAAKRIGKPIDGHAPGLRGETARTYFAAGISTDHECFSYEEGLDKARLGVRILIREGSAAKNFNALIPLLREFPEQIMFCSDDKHPDDLVHGHINSLCARAAAEGYDLFDVLRAACMRPVLHYRLPVGLLRPGDPADFIQLEDLKSFRVAKTWINGQLVAENGRSLLPYHPSEVSNQFNIAPKSPADFRMPAASATVRAIKAIDGEIVTEESVMPARVENGLALSDPDRDLLKIAVVNRYNEAPVALGFITGFQLRGGALASCVAHDSHNIVAVGVDDEALCRAVNAVIANKGGISAVYGEAEQVLPLPIAGIMTPADGYEVAEQYTLIDRFVKETLGSPLRAPFMTLSFMALPVIPALKMTDKGLFDGRSFQYADPFLL